MFKGLLRQFLFWAIVCFVLALVSATVGWGSDSPFQTAGRLLFFIFMPLFVLSLVLGMIQCGSLRKMGEQ